MRRTLSLSREHLTDLTPDDLTSVVGGDAWTVPQCQVEMAKLVVELLVTGLPVTRTCNA